MVYRDKYAFLSNMITLITPITYNGLTGYSVEALFQAMKTLDREEQIYISSLKPLGARLEGRHVKLRKDWENIKLKVMEDLLELKFKIPYYRNLLLCTGDVELIEDNTWNDYYWGRCNGKGENHLGKLQMKIRDRYNTIASVKSKVYIGNLYSKATLGYYDYVGFTANNVLNSKGELVMGKGNALTVKNLYPELPKAIAPKIKDKYFLAFHNNIFAFQSKYHFKDDGDLKLISKSYDALKLHTKANSDKTFALPIPGIGNGNLDIDDVLEIFKDLPNNIHLWISPTSYTYTGIGTRGSKVINDIEGEEKEYIEYIAKKLSTTFTCRTGDAPGTDMAFKLASNNKTESYIPWSGFNNSDSLLFNQPPMAKALASLNHPYWDKLSGPVVKLMSRNSLQVLGGDLKTPSDFVVCYTKDGCNSHRTRTNKTGGTGLAISLASKIGIPVLNISNKVDRDKLDLMIKSLY